MEVWGGRGRGRGGEGGEGCYKKRALVLICADYVWHAQRGACSGGGHGREDDAVAAAVERGSKAHDWEEGRQGEGGGKRDVVGIDCGVHDEEIEDGVKGEGADAG
jgi:hypothetical protein